MDIEIVKCACCGLKEDCTQDYINEVKSNFNNNWLCGLCSESVRDEAIRGSYKAQYCTTTTIEEAVKAHMSFCGKFRSCSNPAVRVADGMRQMLRRRSSDLSSSSSSSNQGSVKRFGRSATISPGCI